MTEQRTELPPARPDRTSVLAIGLEKYQLPRRWNLPGAGRQAVEFGRWAIERGVPPQRVRLGCTWAEESASNAIASLGTRVVDLDGESLIATIDDLMEEGGDLLLVYWCGHGLAGSQLERRLLTAGARENHLANVLVSDIQARFQSELGVGFPRQTFIVDACANLPAQPDGFRVALPEMRMQPTGIRRTHQNFYFSTDVGQFAQFDAADAGAVFSSAILKEMGRSEPSPFPPDFASIFESAEREIDDRVRQTPVFVS